MLEDNVQSVECIENKNNCPERPGCQYGYLTDWRRIRALCLDMRVSLFLSICLCSSVGRGETQRRIIPVKLEVREGEEMQLHLTRAFTDEVSCYVKTASLMSCNLKAAAEDTGTGCEKRFKYWPTNGRCGLIVKDIRKSDQGWWRLTSKNGEQRRIVDAVEVTVLDRYNPIEPNVSIASGWEYSLHFQDISQYCLVKRPHDKTGTVLRSECSINQRFSSADSGDWEAVVGVNGQIDELRKKKTVSVHKERLVSGYDVSPGNDTLHLYCNVKAYRVSLKVCRFSKSGINALGLRLRDGLRKGRYSYYGNGLESGDCGLTIESPSKEDYGRWYCVVDVGSKETLSAMIQADRLSREIGLLLRRTWSTTPVITTLGEQLNLECFANVPLSYCWFSRPDGSRLTKPTEGSPVQNEEPVSTLDLLDNNLSVGRCAVTINNVNISHDGEWTCHMGPESVGVEMTERISVRIAETLLVAVKKTVSAGKSSRNVALECKTFPQAMSLDYCRFYSPKGFGININEKATAHTPIKHGDSSYWYAGEKLDAGDCGLIISSVNPDHTGEWVCAAKLEHRGQEEEMIDTIQLIYTPETEIDTESMTAAAATGIVFGASLILIAIGLAVVRAVKRFGPPRCWKWPRRNETGRVESIRFRSSTNSSSSNSGTEL